MKALNPLFILAILLSCNSQDKNKASFDSKQSTSQQSSLLNCYRYASESDTINLKLVHVGKSITGILVYRLKDKENINGTIQGSMREDVLVANYSILTEGIKSIKQVAFRLEGNAFVEGHGDSFDQDGKQVFKNLDSLTYSSSVKLIEIPCQ
ncbi:MAG: hypothetical protein QM802_07195 [Agriterribacter sp.]